MLVDAVLRLEPELRLLEGLMAVLRALGETADSIEPIALAVLAHSGSSTLNSALAIWQTAYAEIESIRSAS